MYTGGDSQLRHAIANLVAAVVGLPTKSNHLWYHMFEPKELQDTYMVGFMVRKLWLKNYGMYMQHLYNNMPVHICNDDDVGLHHEIMSCPLELTYYPNQE